MILHYVSERRNILHCCSMMLNNHKMSKINQIEETFISSSFTSFKSKNTPSNHCIVFCQVKIFQKLYIPVYQKFYERYEHPITK